MATSDGPGWRFGGDDPPVSRGLSDVEPDDLAEQVLACWDELLDLVSTCDLTRPSRLPGWRGHEVAVHLGAWDERLPLQGLVDSARAGALGPETDADADNARVVAAHRDASTDEVLAALVRARDAVEAFFESALPAEVGRLPAQSSLGPLPVLSLVHASAYEIAVHALDLGPCGAPPPSDALLDRGLAALLDVTGALAARSAIEASVTAVAPAGGWAATSGPHGWTTAPVPHGPYDGPGVRGAAADLLDASAGRASLPQLLVSRRLVVQDLPGFMRLAPIVSDVPGLPGGAALRVGVSGLSKVGGLVSRLRR